MKLALALILAASPAFADPGELVCAARDVLSGKLAEGWGEASVFQGVASDGMSMVEIFARPDGSWTAVIVRPDGVACPVAAGSVWIGFGVPQGEAG